MNQWPLSNLVICLGIFLTGIANATQPPKGFRDFSWGSPISNRIKKLSGPTSDGTALYIPKSGQALAPLLGIPVAEEMYSFTYGKFYSGSAWLDGQENFERMKGAITRELGAPSFTNGRLFKWKWPSSKIEVHLYYQAKFMRTTVIYLNNSI